VCIDLKPRVVSVNTTLITVEELITEIRFEIEEIVEGLDMLPTRTSIILSHSSLSLHTDTTATNTTTITVLYYYY